VRAGRVAPVDDAHAAPIQESRRAEAS